MLNVLIKWVCWTKKDFENKVVVMWHITAAVIHSNKCEYNGLREISH